MAITLARPPSLRTLGWSAVVLLLLAPAVAMLAGAEGVHWTAQDFVAAAIMLGGTGLAIELAVRRFPARSARLGAALALLSALVQVWINAAVGIIGNEQNDLNFMFVAVIGVALVGCVVTKLQPARMATIMKVTAITQVAAGIVGLLAGSPEALVLSLVFAAGWLVSGRLFSRAS